MHLAFVLGTRPEISKRSSLISACIREGVEYTLIHTNQHCAAAMDRLFFDELGLPLAHVNPGVGSGPAGVQPARMIAGIEPVLQAMRPDCVIVQGDTTARWPRARQALQWHTLKQGYAVSTERCRRRRTGCCLIICPVSGFALRCCK